MFYVISLIEINKIRGYVECMFIKQLYLIKQ